MQEKLKAISTKDICVICGEYVPEGSMVCPHCMMGRYPTNGKLKPIRITPEQAEIIIKTRQPLGLFFLNDKTGDGRKVYVGIDNSTGDAWTEEFGSKTACVRWLRGR
jgi:hypothetical protein